MTDPLSFSGGQYDTPPFYSGEQKNRTFTQSLTLGQEGAFN